MRKPASARPRTSSSLTQKQEQGGEVAHADVIKAQIDLQTPPARPPGGPALHREGQDRAGVLIFPAVRSDFSVVDDLLPAIAGFLKWARRRQARSSTSPDLKAATAGVQEAGLEITVARYGYLPSLGLDFSMESMPTSSPIHSTHYPAELGRDIPSRLNLGYVAQATLNIPVWTWGATRSKIKQAELKRDQAQLDLTLAQRTLQGNVAAAYAEARGAQAQLDLLRGSIDLATESLRLTGCGTRPAKPPPSK